MSAFKIVFWGAAQSGKTSILSKAVTDQFSKDYVPTIGANSFLKAIGSSQDWFSIWDLAGDEKFRNVITHYFKESKALVYCIDLTQEADNNAIKRDLAAFRKLVPNAPIILVGTKSDLPNPKISSEQLAALALEHQAKAHFITSAKNNGNINKLFEGILGFCVPAVHAPQHAQILAKLPASSLLHASLDNLFKRLHTLPPAKHNAIVSAADTLVTALQNPSDAQAKSAAIRTFKTNCDKVVERSTCETIVKAIEVVVSAAFFTLIAAMIGFGIGFACGAWTGPGALITGLLGASAAAIGIVVSSGTVGVAAGGLTTYRLFKPSPISSKLIDAVVTAAGENFEPLSPQPEVV